MSRSNIEELIGMLWIIAALLAFSNNYRIWGYVFALKGGFDQLCSICFAIINRESRIKNQGAGHENAQEAQNENKI